MFFIHGGAFMAGTQIKMGPERLGDVADIVLVAINYRVGPLGNKIYQIQIGNTERWARNLLNQPFDRQSY